MHCWNFQHNNDQKTRNIKTAIAFFWNRNIVYLIKIDQFKILI